MDYRHELTEFALDRVGGLLVIALDSGEVLYADEKIKKTYGKDIIGKIGNDAFYWLDGSPVLPVDGSVVHWESVEPGLKKYYDIQSARFVKNGKDISVHFLSDITEYMELSRDMSKYMAFFKRLSGFQTAVLEKLSHTYYELLPLLTDFFKTANAYMLLEQDGNLDVISYCRQQKEYNTDRIEIDDSLVTILEMREDEYVSFSSMPDKLKTVLNQYGNAYQMIYKKLCSGMVSGQRYVIYLDETPGMDKASLKEKPLLNVINLYIENGILHEKLVYESEHDKLTGLYNKGKYLAMESTYANLDSIGIFNLDVNNLKNMNDNFGHEAGDRLLIKAANSIRKVVNGDVHGYRMGGDEYMIIACNVTEDEVNVLKARWEEALAKLNQADDGIECVIAAGVVYGEGNYDFTKLLKDADEKMYEDKRAKKKPGEQIR